MLRDPHGAAISPDGEYVAFVVGQATRETNSYRSGFFVVGTTPGAAPRNLGTAGMPHWDQINQWVSETPQWSRDSKLVALRARMASDETWQVYGADAGGTRLSQWTHLDGDVVGYNWTEDNAKLIVEIEKPIEVEAVERVAQHGILYDGTVSLFQGLPIANQLAGRMPRKREFWIHVLATGEERRATESEIGSQALRSPESIHALASTSLAETRRGLHYLDGAVSPDGRMVVFRYYRESASKTERMSYELVTKAMHGESVARQTRQAFFISQYWWTADSKRIFYTEYSGDGRPERLMAWTIADGTVREVLQPDDVLTDYSMDGAGRYAVCTRENNTTPPELSLVDINAGTIRTLVDLNPEFHSLRLSPATRLEGRNKYGDSWFAHLVKPLDFEQGRTYPLVVTTYRSGNFFLRGGSGNEYPIQVFAAQGMAVLNFDVGYSRYFRSGDFDAALEQWGSPLASIEMAVHRLVREGLVDPRKIAITGFSHGAEITDYAISHSSLFAAAIESGGGATDPNFYYLAPERWHQLYSKWGVGGWPEGKSRKNWKRLSPSLNADRVTAALLINVADSEAIGALPLYTSLQQLRKPVEMFIYPQELHVKDQPKHREEIYGRNVDWLLFWLEGKVDAGPEKRGRYERWCQVARDRRDSNAIPDACGSIRSAGKGDVN